MKKYLTKMAQEAKAAARILQTLPAQVKNKALETMAKDLLNSSRSLLRANKQDLQLARRQGLSEALIDRLLLNQQRIMQMSDSLKTVAALADPVG
ncbi:MAG: gamma-glutamyl-phosphate reductase, partial [Candidatus Omnitrophica bacterium]|nr:gamma-glutamyl-phosphate reductase [Candidatus Omnitrophota bacterium]